MTACRITYPKDQRERAKARGETLFVIAVDDRFGKEKLGQVTISGSTPEVAAIIKRAIGEVIAYYAQPQEKVDGILAVTVDTRKKAT